MSRGNVHASSVFLRLHAWQSFAHHNKQAVFLPAQTKDMGSAVRLSLLGLLLCTQLDTAPARSPRTTDQVSEADIQRLLHGVMEQLGIARPRVEYPAHQATNIVGPQSIQGEEKSAAAVVQCKIDV